MTTDPGLPRHVVIHGSALSAARTRLALSTLDEGDLGLIDGTAGQDVLVVHGTSVARIGNAVLVCLVAADGVRCHRVVDGELGEQVATTVVPASLDVFDRVRGIFETDVLRDRSVAVLGLGSGGSFIVRELAKAGVGRFLLLDHDRLEPGNVSRHECGLNDVGRLKALAMRDLVRRHNPAAEVVTSTLHVDGTTRHQVVEQIQKVGADLVICATDSRESRLLINRLCLDNDLPLILGGVFQRAYGGIVQRVIPGLTACYQCFVQALPRQAGDNEISSEADAARFSYTDREVLPQPGLSTDVIPIALHMAKLALVELLGEESPAFRGLSEDLVAPLFQWINRREAAHAALEPMGVSVDELSVLRWYGVLLPKLDDCATCAKPEALVTDDDMFTVAGDS
ncbi:ThiF family adenylyltransferase [Nonomuraea sp. NPDC002799]